MQKQNFLKASSLANTVFVCLIIAIFCGSLVLISHYNVLINSKLELQNELIDRNESAFIYFLNNLESVSGEGEIDVFKDGIKSYAKEREWGFYSILNCKTIFKGDTVSKMALIGKKNNTKNRLALYTTDYDKPLKLSGNTKISGTLKVPGGRTEQAFINGKIGNAVKVIGRQLKSEDKLPSIEKVIGINPEHYKTIIIEEDNKQIINGFDEETVAVLFDNVAQIDHLILKGNIIIYSKRELVIKATTVLHDVLLVAPKVIIEEGFKGNVQIIAEQDVVIKNNVSLTYPSSIYIENDIDSVSVYIGAKSKIIGGIVVNGKTYKGSLKRQLVVDEKATIVGNIYCYGKTQLQGKVFGSVYSDRFFLKTTSSNYENIILNASVYNDSLPKDFIELPLFKNLSKKITHEIIKTF